MRLPLVYVRSSGKDHGLGQQIEGPGPSLSLEGKEVLLIEDPYLDRRIFDQGHQGTSGDQVPGFPTAFRSSPMALMPHRRPFPLLLNRWVMSVCSIMTRCCRLRRSPDTLTGMVWNFFLPGGKTPSAGAEPMGSSRGCSNEYV